jgi:hypothetical protein
MKAATAIMGALFGGMPNLIPNRISEPKKAKNPNSAESQYLIGCAEEKREKRNAKRLETALRVEADAAAFAGRPRGMVSIHTRYGVGPYNVPEYFAERDAIRAAIDAHNTEFNPKGKKPNPKKSLAADSLLRLAADEKPAKIAKNDRRKQRAAILSLAAIARLPKERNTVKKKAFKGVGTPRAKH